MSAIYPNQLAQNLKPLPALVLLWGEDAGAIRQATQQVVKAIGVDTADPFACEKLTLSDLQTTPTRLAESAQTLSFTSPHRLILLQGIAGTEGASTLATLTEAVKNTLTFPLQGVTIVLPVPHALEKSSPLVKALETHPQALSVRFFVESGINLSQWLQTELKALGQTIEPEALQLLTEGLGADRELARRELEKLVIYAGPETPLTAAHIHESLAGSTPADAFRLAEAVGQRNPQKTDQLLQNLLGQGEDLSAAFTLTLRHLALLKQAQALRQQGQPDAEILKLTGKLRAPKPAQNDFLNQTKRYPPQRLQTLPEYAIETLTHARSGLMDGNFVLHRTLLALSA